MRKKQNQKKEKSAEESLNLFLNRAHFILAAISIATSGSLYFMVKTFLIIISPLILFLLYLIGLFIYDYFLFKIRIAPDQDPPNNTVFRLVVNDLKYYYKKFLKKEG